MLPIAVITGVVGVAAGLLIGLVAFGDDDDEPARPEGAAADAAAGCALLAGLPDEVPERLDTDKWSIDGPYIWRLQGASGAFAAAAAESREYRALEENGRALYEGLRVFDLDRTNEALTDLRDWCDERDLGG